MLRLRQRPLLVAICALVPMVEVAALWVAGLANDRAVALQASAPSPWGQFHDLRWLLVIHDSWLTLVLEAAGIWAARSALDALIVQLASPSPPDRPWTRRFLYQGGFTAIIWVLLFPWAVIVFDMNVVSVSWLLIAALPPVVMIAMVVHHGPVTPSWWHRVPPLRTVGWIALTFAVQTVASVLIGSVPAGLWIPIAAATGVFNAWAWSAIVEAVSGQAPEGRWVPLAPGVAVGMVAVAVVGTTISFAVVGHRHVPLRPVTAAPSAQGEPPVLVVGGFDSTLTGAVPSPIPGPYMEVRFSYRGSDPAGRPLPYQAGDTHQAIATLVRLMAIQVDRLHQRTGQPVSIVAESEGSLIARVYVAAEPDAPLSKLVLLSPLDQPGRVYYPPSGAEGYGTFTGWGLRLMSGVLDQISPIQLPPDSPLLRSIVDHAAALRNLLSCPVPGVSETLVEPLADALANPSNPAPAIATVVVAAYHGGLLTNRTAQKDVSRLLADEPVHNSSVLGDAETLMRRAAAGWQVPSLPLAVEGSGPDHPSCPMMAADVERWISSSR